MGNSGSAPQAVSPFVRRHESFGPASPRRQKDRIDATLPSFGSSDRLSSIERAGKAASIRKADRSQSLEQRSIFSGSHSPSSSQSSSNSYLNAIGDKACLRQSTQPKFQISGDLNPNQVNLVKRAWKQSLKTVDEDETELAVRLLLRIFQLDHRNQVLFGLGDVPFTDLRMNPLFIRHVKTLEPTLVHVMSHPTNATNLSKYLQHLGGKHVQNTGVTYKCSYWKMFVQALMDINNIDRASRDSYEAFFVLGNFCVEQMRIGYKIEYLLQREAERIALVQQKKRDAVNEGYGPGGKKVV